MNRAEKVRVIEEMSEVLRQSPHVILAGYRGLSVNQATELRRRVRESGGHYRVIKNRLARRAAQGTPVEAIAEQFTGPCALVTHGTDPALLAKTLSEFAKTNPELTLVAGLVDAKDVVDASGVKLLSELPGLPELRAQLLALIQTPATQLVRLLQTPAEQLARVIRVHHEGGDGASEE